MTKSNVFFIIVGFCIATILFGVCTKRDIEEEFYAIPEVSYMYITSTLYDQGCISPTMAQIVEYYNKHRISCDSVVIDVECRDRLSSMLNEYCNLQIINCERLDPIWNEIQSLSLKELQNRELDVYCEQDWYQYANMH